MSRFRLARAIGVTVSSSFKPYTVKQMLLGGGVSPAGICCPSSFPWGTHRRPGWQNREVETEVRGLRRMKVGGRQCAALLQVQPYRLLSCLLSQEMEKLGVWMREPGEHRGVVN